jgi:hypothetical protein
MYPTDEFIAEVAEAGPAPHLVGSRDRRDSPEVESQGVIGIGGFSEVHKVYIRSKFGL